MPKVSLRMKPAALRSIFPCNGFVYLLLVLQILAHCKLNLAYSDYPLLIVISFDGFRYDYLNKTDTPNFDKLTSDGVRAPWIEARFITKTFPNHFSIATGLYEESHGIVANNFYDPVLNDTFRLGDLDSKWWDTGAVPLWVTNQQAASDRHSGGMMWPGTAARIQNQTANHYYNYSDSVTWIERVDGVMSWITNETDPANCVFLYFEEPDSAGHKYGPDSPQVVTEIQNADNITGYLINKLIEAKLYDKVNIIITSDHGMANVPNKNYINMTAIVDPKLYKFYGSSPVWSILPNPGKEDEVYNGFLKASKTSDFKVYKKADIPEVYHYKNNRRILPILLVSSENWDIAPWAEDEGGSVHGNHGYNNSIASMHPFFIAHGPDFKKGFLSKPFRNIDIYPLMCHLLGVSPRPNNGTLDNVKDLLRYPPSDSIDSTVLIVVAVLLGFCLLIAVFAILALYRRSKNEQAPPSGAVEVPAAVARKANEPANTEEQRSLMASPLEDDT